jgi:hypothetical protein
MGNIYSSPIVVDVDGDGKQEVLEQSLDALYCLNATGGQKWKCNIRGYSTSPAVADVDGDGKLDLIVGSTDGTIYCLNSTGSEEWNYVTGGAIYFSSPVVADIDGDGRLEVLVGSSDGFLYCLSVVGAPFKASAYPWSSIGFQGDIRHTGCYIDTDHDGLTNNYEVTVGSDSSRVDTDGDGFTDYEEFLVSTDPLVDNNPPATINSLVTGSATSTSITLTWTAPGNNGMKGNATGYWVKYSTTAAITAANWGSATNYTSAKSWVPAKNGTTETRVVSGLKNATRYWFAVKTYDKVPNYGNISNSPSGTTVDAFPPATITNLAASNPTNTSIMLTWTAPGDNGTLGTATGYIVKYSTSGQITASNWASAATFDQSWAPLAGGSAETHVITGLSPDTTYWIAIKAYDKVPNYGAVSNSVSATTTAQGGGLPVILVAAVGIVAVVAVGVVIAAVKMKKK